MGTTPHAPASPPWFEIENRRIERLRRTRRIEIFANEPDRAAFSAEEYDVFLTINTPRGFNDRLRPDLGDCHLWIRKGMYLGFDKAEVFHRTEEPCYVTDNLRSSCKPGRMAKGRCIGKFPHDIVGYERLPLRVVIDER